MSEEGFDADLKSVRTFLEQHKSSYYRAPAWQRFYVWDKDDVTKFLDDAKQAQDKKAEHFLGSIIRTRVDPRNNEYLVVDGQQRLTTITLVLLTVARLAPNAKASAKYRDLATFVASSGKRVVRWTPTGLDTRQMHSVLKDLFDSANIEAHLPGSVKPEGEQTGPLYNAYITIGRRLKPLGWKEQKHIADGLLGRLMIVDIVVPSRVDPMQVFASVNGTGKPLQPSDLIRNSIFQRFGANRARMEEFRKTKWMSIDEPLKKYRLHEQFFNNLAVQKDSSATKAKTFDVLVDAWDRQKPNAIAKEIKPSLGSFLAFAVPEGKELPEEKQTGKAWEELREAMVRIRHVDSKAAWPYLLPLLDNAKGQGAIYYRDVARCIRLVESLFVRLLLGGRGVTGTRYFFVGLESKVKNSPSKLKAAICNERNGELHGYDDKELRNRLLTRDVYDKKLTKGARYLLETHERIQHGWTFPQLLKHYGDADHIMPRNPNSYAHWGVTPVEYAENINRIGNIVLLDPESNQGKSNLGGPQKDEWARIQNIYTMAPYYRRCAEIASEYETWGIPQISQRAEALCDFAFSSPDGWPSFD